MHTTSDGTHDAPRWPGATAAGTPRTRGAPHPSTRPAAPALRVGDAERGEVRDVLARHYAAGRLDAAEYEQRLDVALAARTAGDLAPALADLPHVSSPTEESARTRQQRGWALGALRGWLGLCVLLVGIWLLTTPGGYFWPVWPILGTGWCTVPAALGALRGDGGRNPRR